MKEEIIKLAIDIKQDTRRHYLNDLCIKPILSGRIIILELVNLRLDPILALAIKDRA